MKKTGLLLTAMSALIVCPIVSPAQTCGDVNNNGSTNISDMVQLIDYMGFGPTPANLAMADCDGRAGITLSDEITIMNYLFNGGMLNCNPTGVYSNNYTIGDSLFWPYMLNVPEDIDTVSIPVSVLLQPDAQGYYIPFLNKGTGSEGLFRLNTVTYPSTSMINYAQSLSDTTVLITSHWNETVYRGLNTIFTLHYVRIAPGIANIVPQLLERTESRFPSFERDADMFRFAVSPLQHYLPPETLKASPSSLSYTSQAGKVPTDSFEVSFTSNSVPIDFTVVSPEPWIILTDVPFSGFTTPASVWVKADATALGIGDYTGSIQILPTDSTIAVSPDSIVVTFHVTPPIVYPPGDFNCDGICDLSDLSALISYMTGGGYVLKHCNQF